MSHLTKLLFFVILATVSSCTYKWTAIPEIEKKYENCKPSVIHSQQMVFVPGYKDTVIIIEDCRFFRREKVSIVLRYFEIYWNSRFGYSHSVSNNLRQLAIMFSFEEKTSAGYTIEGKLVDKAKLLGATMSKNSLWIYVTPFVERLCDTSLVHELVHSSIWASNQTHGDPDHIGSIFFGWTEEHNIMIQQLNQHLCELGI